MGVDLDAFAARLHAAREESGTWALQEEDGGVWIDALGDGPAPGDAACRFLREIREDTEDLVAELRVGRRVVEAANAWWAAKEGADGVQLMQLGMALADYDQATGRPDPAAGHESGDTSASQLPPPPAGVRQDLDERERYEYLLACAKDAEDEELAWETIVARVTVGDFIQAAKEVLAFRAAAGHAEPEGQS